MLERPPLCFWRRVGLSKDLAGPVEKAGPGQPVVGLRIVFDASLATDDGGCPAFTVVRPPNAFTNTWEARNSGSRELCESVRGMTGQRGDRLVVPGDL